MHRTKGSVAGRTSILVALVTSYALLLGCQAPGLRILRPTVAQIDAVIPANLRATTSIDKAASDRMDRLISLSRQLGSWDHKGPLQPPFNVDKLPAARRFWKSHEAVFNRIRDLLHEGPLQVRPHPFDPTHASRSADVELARYMPMLDLTRHTSFLGGIFAAAGRFDLAEEAFDLAVLLVDRVMQAGGELTDYFTALLFVGIFDSCLDDAAHLTDCPPSLCRHWLSILSTSRPGDPHLAKAIRTEFQNNDLVLLRNPDKLARQVVNELIDRAMNSNRDELGLHQNDPLFGQLEPIVTAKLKGIVTEVDARNTVEPYSEYDDTGDRIQADEVSGLPNIDDFRPKSPNDAGTKRFIVQMNQTRNSLGRALFANSMCTTDQFGQISACKQRIVVSCGWRTRREALCILLATRIYRHDHSGQLPGRIEDLVPAYLPSVPLDPYNGKPVVLNSASQTVEFNGANLIDLNQAFELESTITEPSHPQSSFSLALKSSNSGKR